jgi:hypothetical protein
MHEGAGLRVQRRRQLLITRCDRREYAVPLTTT